MRGLNSGGRIDDPHSPLRGTFSQWEKVAEGRIRGLNRGGRFDDPHPPLRGTFSHWEKG